MARYFFHLFENGECTKDDVGLELANDELVKHEAMHALPEIAREEVPRDGDRQSLRYW